MPGINRKWLYLLLAAAALVAALVVTGREREARLVGCPEHKVQIDLGHGIIVDSIPIAPNTAGIPEYHDCQRMLVNMDENPGRAGAFGAQHVGRDTVTYGPLVALWVAENAATLFPDEPAGPTSPAETVIGPAPVPGVQDKEAYAIVEVFSWGPDYYRPLGIAPGFSCLYLWRDAGAPTGWLARLVSLGEEPGPCHEPQPIATLSGVTLSVRPVPDAVLSGPDMPPVVRWDRDPVSGHQYIGVRCGQWWCEVGEETGFQSSLPAVDEAAGNAYLLAFTGFEGLETSQRERDRVIGVKGWYDQQVLAIMRDDGKLTPSGVTGTIIPHPALDRAELTSDHFRTWKPAAYIYVDAAYKGKRLSLPKGLTAFDLCFGTAGECGIDPVPTACAAVVDEAWWGRLRPEGGEPEYRCLWHDATSKVIPAGSARWRWLEDDETTWVRCVEGCCTTQ